MDDIVLFLAGLSLCGRETAWHMELPGISSSKDQEGSDSKKLLENSADNSDLDELVV